MTERPSILHLVTDLRIGGTQRCLLARIRDLSAFRHHVLVFALHTKRTGPDLATSFEAAGARVHTLGMHTAASVAVAWLSGHLRRICDRVLSESRPTLLHSTLFHTHLLGDWIAQRAGVPHLASVESTDGWMTPAERRLEGKALRRAKAVIAISEATRKTALRQGVDPDRIRIVLNGIDVAETPPWRPPRVSAVPYLLGVGRLDPIKGWEDLIACLPALRGEFSTLRCDLLGHGPLKGELERRARKLGVADCLEIHGGGPDDLELPAGDGSEASSDANGLVDAWTPILVVPSREEGFGLVLLEGMAQGLPIVATRVGGIPEVVRENREGLLVPPGDREALTRAIRSLLLDRSLARRFGEAGRARASQFSLGRMVEGYEALYWESMALGMSDRETRRAP